MFCKSFQRDEPPAELVPVQPELHDQETQASETTQMPPIQQIVQLPPQQPVIEEHAFKQVITKRRVDSDADDIDDDVIGRVSQSGYLLKERQLKESKRKSQPMVDPNLAVHEMWSSEIWKSKSRKFQKRVVSRMVSLRPNVLNFFNFLVSCLILV